MIKDDKYYEELSKYFSTLANPIRLKILNALIISCSKEKNGCCVYEINNNLELPQPYISKHLKILKDAGILKYEREGNKIYYSFNEVTPLIEIFNYIRELKCC